MLFIYVSLLIDALIHTLRDLTPIILILGFFQFVILRGPMTRPGRTLLGIVYVVLGMGLFMTGLEKAVFPLGELMAKQLTSPKFLFGSTPHITSTIHWQDYAWVYVFAWAIGFATTIAEPALIAVAMKAEKISGGAISAWGLRLSVATGVAIGVATGCFRIVTGTELWIYITTAYVVVMVQTIFANKALVPLAYDSGGVTTSTVTVPLIAALGLGLSSAIPGRNPVMDGFGLIAFASAFPIMSVLAYAQITHWFAQRRKKEEKKCISNC